MEHGPEAVGYWGLDEEALLAAAVNQINPSDLPGAGWELISSMVPRRSAKQCRTKWLNEMKDGICKGPWSLQEEYVLAKVHSQVGNKWSRIAKYLNKRPENTVKNHWSATTRVKNFVRMRTLLWQYVNLVVHQGYEHSPEVFDMACQLYSELTGVPPLSEFRVDQTHFVTGPGKGLSGLDSGIPAPMGRAGDLGMPSPGGTSGQHHRGSSSGGQEWANAMTNLDLFYAPGSAAGMSPDSYEPMPPMMDQPQFELQLVRPECHTAGNKLLAGNSCSIVSDKEFSVVETLGKLATDSSLSAQERLQMIESYVEAVQSFKDNVE